MLGVIAVPSGLLASALTNARADSQKEASTVSRKCPVPTEEDPTEPASESDNRKGA